TDEPTVLRLTANGNEATSIEVNHTTPVTLYCEVQSDVVPARALITAGKGLGRIREWPSNNETLTVTLPSLSCEDSGRFFCSGLNGYEKNDTTKWKYVDINIVCALKPKDPSVVSVPNTIQVSPQDNTVFTLEVYGYPVPTNFGLKIETGRGKEDVDKGGYDITYIPLTPPVGQIKVTIYDANTRGTTTYYVSVKNNVGEAVELRLDVVKNDPVLAEPKPADKGDDNGVAIGVGVGVACAVIVIVVVVVAVYLVRRKQAMRRDARFRNAAAAPRVPNLYDNESVYDHIEEQPVELANPYFNK
ncbi:unnamed protein product, partial [Lymnaea stagnalis]